MKIVVALGGNALIKKGEEGTVETQVKNLRRAVKGIVKLIEDGHQVVVTHGNGPQVGALLIKNEMAVTEVPQDPLVLCVAETQGSLGYLIEQTLYNSLVERGKRPRVATLVTQIEVNKNDPAMKNPTKPVGPFYTQEKALLRMRQGWKMKEDAGRGYRRVVPSPTPLRILNSDALLSLVETGFTVIAGGGGGIPVYRNENGLYEGIDAVIDKDLASLLIAKTIDADAFVILTGVERVALNYRSEKPIWLSKLTVREAKAYMTQGEFPAGSMGPKIKAMVDFVEYRRDALALITSEDKLVEAWEGKTGTRIVYE